MLHRCLNPVVSYINIILQYETISVLLTFILYKITYNTRPNMCIHSQPRL